MKLEKMLKLIDFDFLKEMNEFKLYFKENYHDRLYKWLGYLLNDND